MLQNLAVPIKCVIGQHQQHRNQTYIQNIYLRMDGNGGGSVPSIHLITAQNF